MQTNPDLDPIIEAVVSFKVADDGMDYAVAPRGQRWIKKPDDTVYEKVSDASDDCARRNAIAALRADPVRQQMIVKIGELCSLLRHREPTPTSQMVLNEANALLARAAAQTEES